MQTHEGRSVQRRYFSWRQNGLTDAWLKQAGNTGIKTLGQEREQSRNVNISGNCVGHTGPGKCVYRVCVFTFLLRAPSIPTAFPSDSAAVNGCSFVHQDNSLPLNRIQPEIMSLIWRPLSAAVAHLMSVPSKNPYKSPGMLFDLIPPGLRFGVWLGSGTKKNWSREGSLGYNQHCGFVLLTHPFTPTSRLFSLPHPL